MRAGPASLLGWASCRVAALEALEPPGVARAFCWARSHPLLRLVVLVAVRAFWRLPRVLATLGLRGFSHVRGVCPVAALRLRYDQSGLCPIDDYQSDAQLKSSVPNRRGDDSGHESLPNAMVVKSPPH
jgi:hypothetical protein